jgi:hypothetical protein
VHSAVAAGFGSAEDLAAPPLPGPADAPAHRRTTRTCTPPSRPASSPRRILRLRRYPARRMLLRTGGRPERALRRRWPASALRRTLRLRRYPARRMLLRTGGRPERALRRRGRLRLRGGLCGFAATRPRGCFRALADDPSVHSAVAGRLRPRGGLCGFAATRPRGCSRALADDPSVHSASRPAFRSPIKWRRRPDTRRRPSPRREEPTL